ncbi:hypothetical protein CPC735_017280 [Coccidioides posadasii C735 delta SOWgp]|uniref:SRP9 domain-containing protein n=1 Tax=Coccidioides posadasii (strain C735) TaxID=222929 RepID=C5PDG5_COCP7|nr:hypothetical protein CPC735_017280 [Coccidioides posadasii C735 delta SOWgp]EER25126.1 hypothetical protein CPC735_017280 [Coccidioides posadasii C735 delta SOWgp]|eukprot:XP_003067271.1 hypothetical protein CPC735_017280 [Coccidioides posadasii C735 delta SOWgp]
MPYLTTSQDFLKQSSLLLEAYPHTTRITTKYSYPKPSHKSKPTTATATTSTTSSSQPVSKPATLTLKTYNPYNGICLKYRTTKAAEVSRLIAGLGRLASGAPIADAGQSHAVSGVSGGDADMLDVSVVAGGVAGTGNVTSSATKGNGGGGGKKKKGGKGKR